MISRSVNSSLGLCLGLAVAAAVIGAPPSAAAANDVRAKVTGSAAYRERIALSPSAVFEATLQDVSRADAPAEEIGHVRKINPGQVPITFEITYDPRRIDAAGKYVVRATIFEEGRLRFTSGQAHPVLTHGHGDKVTILLRGISEEEEEHEVERPEPASTLGTLPATFTGQLPCADCAGIRYQIDLQPGGHYMQRTTYLRDGRDESFYELGAWSLSEDGRMLTLSGAAKDKAQWAVKDRQSLQKLDREGRPIDPSPRYELARSAILEPVEPRLKLTGMFRYMADAARFRDCRTGLQWPVALSDDYAALERAYTGRRGEPGGELLVSIQGRIEQRPKMEGRGIEATLVVEKFVRAMPGESCEERPATRPGLANNRWAPVRIGEQTVIMPGQQREPWIELDPRSKRMTGSGGCNRISGGYTSGNGTLRFRQIISTKMACPAMEIEMEFLRALENTRRYRVVGRVLELLDKHGKLLAQLEERNLG